MAQADHMSEGGLGAKALVNLIMQFRKVCNHPDLFERADVISPFVFGTFPQSGNLARQGDLLYCPDSGKNAIEVGLPKILWTDGGVLSRPMEEKKETGVMGRLMSIWKEDWVEDRLKQGGEGWGWMNLLGLGASGVVRKAKAHPLVSLVEESDSVGKKEQIAVKR
jgi:DNA helicase INO80